MTGAKIGDRVKVRYIGKLPDGTEFDASPDGDPLEFSIGYKHVIAGFEEAVIGMRCGDQRTVTVPAERAYGPYQEKMVVELERELFPAGMVLEKGRQVEVTQPNDEKVMLMVTEVGEKTVTVDANHPLAGKPLTFTIELLELHSI